MKEFAVVFESEKMSYEQTTYIREDLLDITLKLINDSSKMKLVEVYEI